MTATLSRAPLALRQFWRRWRLWILSASAWALAAALLWAAPGPNFALVLAVFLPLLLGIAVFAGAGPGLMVLTLSLIAAAMLLGADELRLALLAALGAVTLGIAHFVRPRSGGGASAMQVLAEREAQLRSIYDTAPDALIVIDERGVMQSYNAAAERMFGWSASEALGRNVRMLMPDPYRTQHDSYIGHYLDTGERRIIGIGRIVVGERKDGSTFPMELAVGEVRSEQGRVFTGFVRDLSERQATETRLQELQHELVHMSRLTAMGEMASSLAHELNQPLSAIANYLSGARRLLERAGVDEPRALDALEKAADQAIRAGDIIRRLRDFLARGEGVRRVESLPKLVQEACALAMVGAKEHGVRVQYKLAPAQAAFVDRVQIQQVIINLVRNALDAMEGQERRALLIASAPGEEGMAVVSVADSGPGVDADVAARLFQPFMTTKAAGMGVGLSISRTIIEAHGGRIWHDANPSGGAVFSFSVPLAPADAAREVADD